jgi:hypothetical protein
LNVLVTAVLVFTIQHLRLKEAAEGLAQRAQPHNIKTQIHDVVNLVRLGITRETFHLTLQKTSKNLLHDCIGLLLRRLRRPLLDRNFTPVHDFVQLHTDVVASFHGVSKELMGILLPAISKMLGKVLQPVVYLHGRINRTFYCQGALDALLQEAEGAIAVVLPIQLITCKHPFPVSTLPTFNKPRKRVLAALHQILDYETQKLTE